MSGNEEELNVIQLEKWLTGLKDSQEAINACCKWCLDNRPHHKKIVTSWLNVLKRVKVEQRLNLFYLANDVIQYSKRQHYEFVESWGTALQKATTLVRDDKVKHKIIRIFNIWKTRGVYNEEFISDLCGLLNVSHTSAKNDEPHEFQASYVVNKIKQCTKLEKETDTNLKLLKEHNPKLQIETDLCSSLKDRAHVDDVEKELETYVQHLEGYINALKAEIKCRISNISVLKQANSHLDKDKKDVKVVANAYKLFGNKVKVFQKKLGEHNVTLNSPVPSPDVNAPSPSPDCDIELPEDSESNSQPNYSESTTTTFSAGYYTPLPTGQPENNDSFASNGFSSFIGANFNIDNLFSTKPEISTNGDNFPTIVQPPLPTSGPRTGSSFPYQDGGGHLPLLPPPMPPFNPKSDYDTNYQYNTNPEYDSNVYAASEEYNPEQEPETWDTDPNWLPTHIDTPESPPNFEKEGYVEGVEYHDGTAVATGIDDVDHRVLHPIHPTENRRVADVDHRNLISLTGSPAQTNSTENWTQDQDYRVESSAVPNADQDYRLPAFNFEQLKLLPPPPPPPPKPADVKSLPRKLQDNVESIDMDLSEDEQDDGRFRHFDGIATLKPPPPLLDLPDDVDANSFLDDLTDEINSNEFTANLQDTEYNAGYPYPPNFHPNTMPPPMAPDNWGFNSNFYGKNNRGPYNNRGFTRSRPRVFPRPYGNFRGRGFGRGCRAGFKPRGQNRGNY